MRVVTDRKLAVLGNANGIVESFVPDVVQYSDYYPFGWQIPDRGASQTDYSYGFNGMEKDDEIKSSECSSYDFGARMYDPRVGRWLSRDPLFFKQPDQSPYKAFLNCPILFADPDGRDEFQRIIVYNEKGQLQRTNAKKVKADVYLSGGPHPDANFGSLSNGYNFYSKTTRVIVDSEGNFLKSVVDHDKAIKRKDGIQDREYSIGAEDKGTEYEAGESNYEGKGEYQAGGWALKTDAGGSSPTKTRSTSAAEQRNIGALLTYFGSGGRASSVKDMDFLDLINNGKGIIEEINSSTQEDSDIALIFQ
jgi:RHS repeat-associated protein